MVPVNRRRQVSSAANSVYNTASTCYRFVGAATWILSTTILLVVIPLGMEIEKEQMLVAMETEQKLQQQQAQQVRRFFFSLFWMACLFCSPLLSFFLFLFPP